MNVTRSSKMAGWRQVVELAMTNEEVARLVGGIAFAHGACEPGGAGANASRLPGEPIVFCGCTKGRRPSPDGPTLRRTSAGLWSPGGPRRPTATWQRADNHAAGQGLVGLLGVRQGQGARVSARAVDYAPAAPPCARAWTDGRTPLPGQAGSGHRLQDSQPGGNQAAQGALLPGVPGRRV